MIEAKGVKIDGFLKLKADHFLLGILLLGTLLRLYHINFQSLWVDELYSIIPTNPDASIASIIEYCKSDQPPVFFLYIHYVFKLFGYNELVGRVASAVIGVAGIFAVYLLGRECEGKSTGLFAAFVTSINYFNIYYSQELRFYSTAFLLSTLSYLFFIRAYKKSEAKNFIGYILTTVGLLYTHYYGMIIFFSQILTFFFLLRHKKDTKFIVFAIVSGIVIVAAFSPWLSTILNGLSEVLPHIKRPEPQFLAQYFYYYTGKDALSTVIFCIFIFLFVRSVASKKYCDKSKPIYFIIIIWIVVSYLVPYLRSMFVTPMLVDRYTIVTLPAWIILFALGWNKVGNLRLKYFLPILLVTAAVINLLFFKQHYTRLIKDQWREASNIVLSENQFHYPVYSPYPWHFNFYFRNQPKKVNDFYTSDLSDVKNLWFLTAHFTEEEMEAQIATLQEKFVVKERHTFFRANAVLLERKH